MQARGLSIETPKALRGRGMRMGYNPLPCRLKDLGSVVTLIRHSTSIIINVSSHSKAWGGSPATNDFHFSRLIWGPKIASGCIYFSEFHPSENYKNLRLFSAFLQADRTWIHVHKLFGKLPKWNLNSRVIYCDSWISGTVTKLIDSMSNAQFLPSRSRGHNSTHRNHVVISWSKWAVFFSCRVCVWR